ncbi:MAG: hypothetical protein HYV63_15670 [Candidatus Schekmanbacteria bacterium]|nr:hypothetical protein [Candidatus Schekmanbacteria bacterium]
MQAKQSWSTKITGVPDYDQKRDDLPKNGKNYCVPTVTMNGFSYAAYHGWLQAIYPFYLMWFDLWDTYDGITSGINLLGAFMDTDADSGTNHSDAIDGIYDWLSVSPGHPFSAVFEIEAEDVGGGYGGPGWMQEWLLAGAQIRMGVLWCKGEDHDDCDGGHARSLVGVGYGAWSGGGEGSIVWYRDPAKDDGDINKQSTWKTHKQRAYWNPEAEMYCIGAKKPANKSQACIKRYALMVPWLGAETWDEATAEAAVPYNYNSASSATSLVITRPAFSVDGFGSIESMVVKLPRGASIDGVVFDPIRPRVLVASAMSNAVLAAHVVSGEVETVANVAGPRALALGGHDKTLYVLAKNGLLGLDRHGRTVARAAVSGDTTALAYDPVAQRVVTASASGLRFFDTRLRALYSVALTGLGGREEVLLQADPLRGGLWVLKRGAATAKRVVVKSARDIQVADIALDGVVAARALAVDTSGNLLLSDEGVVKVFSAEGKRRLGASVLDGSRAGRILAVPRSFNSVDPNEPREEERNTLPPEIYGDEELGIVGHGEEEEPTEDDLPQLARAHDRQFRMSCLNVADRAACEKLVAEIGVAYLRVTESQEPGAGPTLAIWKGREAFENCGSEDGPDWNESATCPLQHDGTPEGLAARLPLRDDGTMYAAQRSYEDSDELGKCRRTGVERVFIHGDHDELDIVAKFMNERLDSCAGSQWQAFAVGFAAIH